MDDAAVCNPQEVFNTTGPLSCPAAARAIGQHAIIFTAATMHILTLLECRLPAVQQPAAVAPESMSPQPTAESPQLSQTTSEPSPSQALFPPLNRLTPQPSVIPPPPGQPQAAPATVSTSVGTTFGAQSRQQSSSGSSHRPTRHMSLNTTKAVGVVEAWQRLDGEADLVNVWNKYEEVFFGDYHPLQSTYRR